MKTKLFTVAIMMAVLGTISCSKDVFDENKANELKEAEDAAKQAELVAQYKAAFEQKYGKVDPNQSWDFTGYAAKAKTRGTSNNSSSISMQWDQKGYGRGSYKGPRQEDMQDAILNDIVQVKDLVASVLPVKFPYTYSNVYLFPLYSHGYPMPDGNNYDYYYLGADYTINGSTTSCSYVVPSNVTSVVEPSATFSFRAVVKPPTRIFFNALRWYVVVVVPPPAY